MVGVQNSRFFIFTYKSECKTWGCFLPHIQSFKKVLEVLKGIGAKNILISITVHWLSQNLFNKCPHLPSNAPLSLLTGPQCCEFVTKYSGSVSDLGKVPDPDHV
jgi:hypothetical protein